MKYNLVAIMKRAWELRRVKGYTICAALLLPCDALGIAVADGKTCGLCKYAARNA